MMRKIYLIYIISFYLFLLNISFTKAQNGNTDYYTVLDSALYKITYEVKIVNDTTKTFDKEDDIQVLLIGKKISKSYSKFVYECDSISTEYYKEGATASPSLGKNIPATEVFKNYPDNHITVTQRLISIKQYFFYEEDKIKFNWEITSEKKKCLSYLCQKAITTFRGRIWEAWFTPEIPLSEGPYKFAGLPGLILELHDTKNHYVYKCIGMQQLKQKLPIKMWKWDFQLTSRKALNATRRRYHVRPYDFLESMGIKMMSMKKSESELKNLSFPYNPIELE